MGNTIIVLSDDELRELVKKFDTDGDGKAAAAAAVGSASPDASDNVPFLFILSGDNFNDSLAIPMPTNLASPPSISTDGTVSEQSFDEAVKGLQKATRRARMSRQSAQPITNLLTEVLQEVNEMEGTA